MSLWCSFVFQLDFNSELPTLFLWGGGGGGGQSPIFHLFVHFFSRSFYAKNLSIKVHVVFKVHTFDQYACSVGINHMTLPLLKPRSPIELQEQ